MIIAGISVRLRPNGLQATMVGFTKKVVALLLSIVFTACASSASIETIVADGGEVINGGIGSLIGADGVTLTAVDGTWISYLAPDGKKEVSINPGNAQAILAWYHNDDGVLCEIMYKPRRELCYGDGTVLVKSADGVYTQFTNGNKDEHKFRAVSGNTSGF